MYFIAIGTLKFVPNMTSGIPTVYTNNNTQNTLVLVVFLPMRSFRKLSFSGHLALANLKGFSQNAM
jgi:hypothetical protein